MWLRGDGERRMAAAARRLLMEGRSSSQLSRGTIPGEVGDGRGGDEEEEKRGRGKKSRARWYYGGLPVFGVGWKAKYPVQGPAAGLFWAQLPHSRPREDQARALQ